jgi:colanic acid/amylovoran biosynthesis protein
MIVLYDLAFDLRSPSAEATSTKTTSAEAILLDPNIDIFPDSQRLRVGITIIDRGAQDPQFQNQSNYESALESAITKLIETNQADIFLFVQCYGPSPSHDDRIITNRVYQKLQNDSRKINILESFEDALAIKDAYGLMDMVIGTRMHTGVFALSQGIPAILIGYQPKAKGMMEAVGLDRFYCDIDQISPESLCLMVDNLLDERNLLGLQITERCQALRPIADAWLAHIDN